MASRRPASSRARVNINTNPMPAPQQQLQRPRSVMSKPTVPNRTGEELDNSTSTNTTATATTKSQRGSDDADTHIQVILRCRGRSEREMQANSPAIVQIDEAKAKELTIETSTPTSSLGMVNRPPTRTYPFDLVFGPEATQSMIYHDVVGPMLKEVMLGYNCTLFAYGQTGTGKTYTMQGDLSPTPMGNPSAHAGIIPRVLFRLFHELEKDHTDFIVKVSFIELYNEELRDLLATDLSAPTTLTQPMGMAAKDAKNSDQKLTIFDDATKRGVFIQGLEEIAVKDSKDALALLTKGSERRQIAATKFNDHSSRSHSVFSITVHIKETNAHGDDLLKVGKLNLVDLAGSENIGRSGAENKRAREAGMINQSLLTLGRVINALVDKAQHVPYRESKLTRLLQDSLGGRTKTCIIATISPARSNLEETLSTLDYALRAKSIRNKPELNQRMTRNSLLKEYVVEIEHLKADLIAAREKNGIYFSEETWNQMNTEKELRDTELVEARKQVAIIENQMRNVRDEYDQSIAVLKRREEELQETRGKLKQTEDLLREREREVVRVTTAYEQEVIVRQAHQQTEVELNEVAVDLRSVAQESLQDLTGLFEKLERKNKVFLSNKKVVSENERLIHAFTDVLTKKMAELGQLMHRLSTGLQEEATQFQGSQQEAILDQVDTINNHFKSAQELFKRIERHENFGDKALISLKQQLEKAHKSFDAEVSSWSQNLIASSTQSCEDATNASLEQIGTLEKSAANLYSVLNSFCGNVHDYLEGEHDALSELAALSDTTVAQELAHIQRQNEVLAQMLVNERKEAERAKNNLLQRVSGLLGEFMQKRDDNLKESVSNLQRSNEEVRTLLDSTYARQSQLHGHLVTTNGELEARLQSMAGEGAKENERVVLNVINAKEVVGTSMIDIQDTISNLATSHSSWVNQQTLGIHEVSRSAFEEHTKAKRVRKEATDELYSSAENHHSIQGGFLTSISNQVEGHTKQVIASAKEQILVTRNYEKGTMKNIDSIEQARFNIANNGNKDDASTGTTPRKRKWKYRDEWSLTRSRDDLLGEWNQERHEGGSNSQDGPLAQPLPTNALDDTCQNPTPLEDVVKPDPAKSVDHPVAPLVESRKRNVSTIRAPRRAR